MNCRNKITSLALVLVGSCYGLTASAKCGSVDYTQGADALAMMHDYVVTMMLYVLYLAYVRGEKRSVSICGRSENE